MTEMPSDTIKLHDVDLHHERTLGTPPASDILADRLSIGWDIIPVTELTVLPEWHAYVAACAPSRAFCQLILVCRFKPEIPTARGIFVSAELGLSLRSIGDSAPCPIARRLYPTEMVRPAVGSGGTSKFTFGVRTGILNASIEQQSNDSNKNWDWIVQGDGASQSTPSWKFRRTKDYSLVGDRWVGVLIETLPGWGNVADVLLAAELEHRTLGIRRYRAHLTSDLAAIPLQL